MWHGLPARENTAKMAVPLIITYQLTLTSSRANRQKFEFKEYYSRVSLTFLMQVVF
jgi:hypothetical protein